VSEDQTGTLDFIAHEKRKEVWIEDEGRARVEVKWEEGGGGDKEDTWQEKDEPLKVMGEFDWWGFSATKSLACVEDIWTLYAYVDIQLHHACLCVPGQNILFSKNISFIS